MKGAPGDAGRRDDDTPAAAATIPAVTPPPPAPPADPTSSPTPSTSPAPPPPQQQPAPLPLQRPGRWGSAAVGVAVLTVLTLFTLRAMGRVWWCACRTPTPFSTDVNSMHNSQHLLDAYSFSHLLHGIIFFWVLWAVAPRLSAGGRFFIAMTVEAAWEVVENSPLVIDRYRTATAALGYSGDSIVNVLGDLASCAAGYLLARRAGWKWSAAVIVAVELVMLWLIRDNLFLNVLMLLWPIDAVRQWQSGGAG